MCFGLWRIQLYLKSRPYMQEYADEKKTLCYCMYGCPYKKSTNIWSNMDGAPRPMCNKWFRCLNFVDHHHPQTAQKGPSKIKTGMTQDDDFKSEDTVSHSSWWHNCLIVSRAGGANHLQSREATPFKDTEVSGKE